MAGAFLGSDLNRTLATIADSGQPGPVRSCVWRATRGSWNIGVVSEAEFNRDDVTLLFEVLFDMKALLAQIVDLFEGGDGDDEEEEEETDEP